VVELVDREDLTNAIALKSTMFNMATVVGPAVAGFAYALVGPAWCFTINGISFIAVITALALMKLPEWSMKTASGTILARINEGLDYIRNNQVIIGIISMVGIVGAFGSGIFTLTPAWSVEVLRGDASTNGLMLSARGLGSMIGGLFIAWLSRYKVRGKSFAAGGLLLPVVIAGFAIMTNIPSSLLFLCLVGFFFMLVINNANALIQTAVPDHLRGRVMSIYVLVFFGAQPLGSLLAGELAETINESMTVLIFAALLLLCSIIVFLRVPSLKKLH
jgi:predicted MFS family arabinose efflux permease